MLNLNNVYNYYSTNLITQKNNTRFRSHKQNDLKTIYKNMVKQNQHSPLYKFKFSDSTQLYALGIKEAALALEAESKSLGQQNNHSLEEMTVVSDNENIVYASLSNHKSENLPKKLSIKIDSLATGQTNTGAYLPAGESSFSPGEHSFGIAVGKNQYTFNLTTYEDDTNQQIIQNLANSINTNHIGVNASIRNNRVDGTCALVLQSEQVGLPEHDDLFFRFDETYLKNDITGQLGIDHVETTPANASFYINDTLHTSVSNRISLNHSVNLDLLATTDSPILVRLVPDEDKISDRLDDFLQSYNQLVDIAKNAKNTRGAARLFRDVTSIARRNTETLSAAGLTIDENGYLNRTGEADSGQIKALFDNESSSFRKDIKRVTDKMTLNPLDYIDKVVVTYPNTTGTYPNPYQASKYSGLLFNDYA